MKILVCFLAVSLLPMAAAPTRAAPLILLCDPGTTPFTLEIDLAAQSIIEGGPAGGKFSATITDTEIRWSTQSGPRVWNRYTGDLMMMIDGRENHYSCRPQQRLG